jgi:hypothetical protein
LKRLISGWCGYGLEGLAYHFEEKLLRITDIQEDTSANLPRHSGIFPARRKAAEGLKTKGSKLPDFTKRLPIVV